MTVQISGGYICMQVDTGVAVSVLSETSYQTMWQEGSCPQLKPSIQLCAYSGELMEVKLSVDVSVYYNGQRKQLTLLVLRGAGLPLMGREWLQQLHLGWKELHFVYQRSHQALQTLLQRYKKVYCEELGTIKGIQVKLHVKPDSQPVFIVPVQWLIHCVNELMKSCNA